MRFFTMLRYQPLCLIGIHIPVRIDYPDGRFEYCCQECVKTMTKEQWEAYHERRGTYK